MAGIEPEGGDLLKVPGLAHLHCHIFGLAAAAFPGDHNRCQAKGGVILSVKRELGVPVRWVGVGEGVDDLRPFDAAQFADALFDKNVAAREASDED